jgi:hypothetical protein
MSELADLGMRAKANMKPPVETDNQVFGAPVAGSSCHL